MFLSSTLSLPAWTTILRPSSRHIDVAKPVKTTLVSLPAEIVLAITTYLPPSALISLKFANKRLNAIVPAPADYCFDELSQCEKRTIRRCINENTDLQSGRRRCLLCNTLQELRFFHDDSQICMAERGRFMFVSPPVWLGREMRKRINRLHRNKEDAFWLAIPRTFCLHTLTIVEWTSTACSCHCDSCAHVEVTCYVRVSGRFDTPKAWDVLRDASGREWMGEEHYLEGRLMCGSPYAGSITMVGGSQLTFRKLLPIVSSVTMDRVGRAP